MLRLALAAYLLLFPLAAYADGQSVESQGKIENVSLVRWCDEKTGHEVFSNVPQQGLVQCGAIKTELLCDAEGRRYIGKDHPYGYSNCKIGPRIQMSGEFVDRRKDAVKPEPVVEEKVAKAKEPDKMQITEAKRPDVSDLNSLLSPTGEPGPQMNINDLVNQLNTVAGALKGN